MTSVTENRTTELRISEPLRGFIKHQSNRAYIDGGQASWLTKIADEIDAKHEQAVAATLGRPTWRDSYDQERFDRWYDSLHHNGKPTNFAELVEEIIWMCETIDLGPNGNTCQGVDEGEVQTDGLINYWAKFAATLGGVKLTAEQVREAVMSADRWEKPMGNTGLTNTHLIIRDDGWQAIADELNARAERTCECDGTISWEWTAPTTYYEYELSCGHVITSVDNEPPNYCEECGAKVRKAVKQ